MAMQLPDWTQWLRVAKATSGPASLGRRHIYILPTAYGCAYAFVLLLMLAGAINYALSLGFVLVFLLAGVGMLTMLHTWRNLAHMVLMNSRSTPVFAGDVAQLSIQIAETRHRPRYAIGAELERESPVYADLPADGKAEIRLPVSTTERGWHSVGRIKLHTDFPLGLFHVWGYFMPEEKMLVYPRPSPEALAIPHAPDHEANGGLANISGDEDFFGHRSYQLGDSPRRVDWKASSREQGMLTKQFQGQAESALWLDFDHTPGTDTEQRISRLTRWIIDAEAAHQRYGLRIPGQTISPASGTSHYHQCLQALALMP